MTFFLKMLLLLLLFLLPLALSSDPSTPTEEALSHLSKLRPSLIQEAHSVLRDTPPPSAQYKAVFERYGRDGYTAWGARRFDEAFASWGVAAVLMGDSGDYWGYAARAAEMAGLEREPVLGLWRAAFRMPSQDPMVKGMWPLDAIEDEDEMRRAVRSRFELIYAKRLWSGGDESKPRSGPGSSLEATAPVRPAISALLRSPLLGVKTMMDCGCGDLTWMRTIPEIDGLRYTGVDVACNLIEDHKREFASDRSKRFKCVDLSIPLAWRTPKESLPRGQDLVVMRDVITHMTLAGIKAALDAIVDSGARYLFVTNMPNTLTNSDDSYTMFPVPGVGYRGVNLHISPFHLPQPIFRWVIPTDLAKNKQEGEGDEDPSTERSYPKQFGDRTELLLFKLPFTENQDLPEVAAELASIAQQIVKANQGNADTGEAEQEGEVGEGGEEEEEEGGGAEEQEQQEQEEEEAGETQEHQAPPAPKATKATISFPDDEDEDLNFDLSKLEL